MLDGKDSPRVHLEDAIKFDLRTVLHAIHNAHVVFEDTDIANSMDLAQAIATYAWLIQTALYFGKYSKNNDRIISKVNCLTIPFCGHDGIATVERFYAVQSKFQESLHSLASVNMASRDVKEYIALIITNDFLRS